MLFCILGCACTSRLAQYSGKKSESKAKVVLNLMIMLLLLCGLVPATCYAIFRYPLLRLFTDIEEVVEMAASMTLFAAIDDFGMKLWNHLISQYENESDIRIIIPIILAMRNDKPLNYSARPVFYFSGPARNKIFYFRPVWARENLLSSMT